MYIYRYILACVVRIYKYRNGVNAVPAVTCACDKIFYIYNTIQYVCWLDATAVHARNIIIIRSWRNTSPRLCCSRMLLYNIIFCLFVALFLHLLLLIIILRLFKIKHLSWWYYCERVAFYNGTFVYIYIYILHKETRWYIIIIVFFIT